MSGYILSKGRTISVLVALTGGASVAVCTPVNGAALSPALAVLTPMASMRTIYISPGGGEGIHHASRHPPPSGGPALTGWRDTSTFEGAYSES